MQTYSVDPLTSSKRMTRQNLCCPTMVTFSHRLTLKLLNHLSKSKLESCTHQVWPPSSRQAHNNLTQLRLKSISNNSKSKRLALTAKTTPKISNIHNFNRLTQLHQLTHSRTLSHLGKTLCLKEPCLKLLQPHNPSFPKMTSSMASQKKTSLEWELSYSQLKTKLIESFRAAITSKKFTPSPSNSSLSSRLRSRITLGVLRQGTLHR